ncbi:MAG: leucine-rich repeat domain-containing protein [Promethearchaeota archaeon]
MQSKEQVIRKIHEQKQLSKAEISEKIAQTRRELRYDKDDSIIATLVAQELNVNLGDPTNYLYTVLEYRDQDLVFYLCPLTTISKEKMKKNYERISINEVLERPVWMPISETIFDPEELEIKYSGYVFGRKSQLIIYPEIPEKIDLTLSEIIDQARLISTFTDYRVIRDEETGNAYVPCTLFMERFFPPTRIIEETFIKNVFLDFPYISLEPLKETRDITEFKIPENLNIIDMVCFDLIRYCQKLTHFELSEGTDFQTLDLTPLAHLPVLRYIGILSLRTLTSVVLPPMPPKNSLEDITIFNNGLQSLDLSPLRNCDHLEEISLKDNELTALDLSPLAQLPEFKDLDLSHNRFQTIDLSPLQHCPKFRELRLGDNAITSIDLSPFRNHPSLWELFFNRNSLETIDLSPLDSCPALKYVILTDNPLTHVNQVPIAEIQDLQDTLHYNLRI